MMTTMRALDAKFWLPPSNDSSPTIAQRPVFLGSGKARAHSQVTAFSLTWVVASMHCAAMAFGALVSDRLLDSAERLVEAQFAFEAGVTTWLTILVVLTCSALCVAAAAASWLANGTPTPAKAVLVSMTSLALCAGAGVMLSTTVLTPVPLIALLSLSLSSAWQASFPNGSLRTTAAVGGLAAAGIVLTLDYFVFQGVFAPERPLSLQLPLLLAQLVATFLSIMVTMAVLQWNSSQATAGASWPALLVPVLYHGLLVSALVYLAFLLAAIRRITGGLVR
ncbi:hypothetical protein [Pseudomonas aeruginosa]|uniref:hypothetical protein n=1 Tax=Pseudomonas aeruginosa TaxID=287 RepID=UPI000BB56522|nr:hypothetical protein [Pseudomonas aeruginosa]PBN23778.1 hypothetical protein B8B65_28545 [Pseudomonas aeruginosa]